MTYLYYSTHNSFFLDNNIGLFSYLKKEEKKITNFKYFIYREEKIIAIYSTYSLNFYSQNN